MKMNSDILLLLLGIAVMTSCKSIRKVASTDYSGSVAATQKMGGKKRQFINGIEVTLGTVTTTKQKTTTAGSTGVKKMAKPVSASKTDVEKANWLQIKYAVLVDIPAENLNNIPLLELIDQWWGTRYCIGGSSSNCIDCSGFTQVVMREIFELTLPRTAQEQYNLMQRIEIEDLREGDLVFFNTSGRGISHVGVYLQNNKFVHASTSQGVTITDLGDKYWSPKFRGGGRKRD
ncbi:MAG: hypothetical protein EAZ35_00635 [Sphingobacteriia bacterium]|nr:MAG: hypothetical protein EAZ35_00635 [Sphingobacteriia bacterium]